MKLAVYGECVMQPCLVVPTVSAWLQKLVAICWRSIQVVLQVEELPICDCEAESGCPGDSAKGWRLGGNGDLVKTEKDPMRKSLPRGGGKQLQGMTFWPE